MSGGAHLRFFWSADILVRFRVDRTGEADKNVRAPIAVGPPSEKYQTRDERGAANDLDCILRRILARFGPLAPSCQMVRIHKDNLGIWGACNAVVKFGLNN